MIQSTEKNDRVITKLFSEAFCIREDEVSTSEQNTTSSTHKTTDKVIQILKRNPNISDAELAEQAGLKSEAAARGWRAVAEDTMRGWKWGY